VALVPAVAAAQTEVFSVQADVLGAPANLIVAAASRDAAYTAISASLAEIDRLDRVLSGYRSDSELARLNRAHSRVVSQELFEVLELAEAMRSCSGGAFSARLGGVEALWRGAGDRAPDRAQLRAASLAATQPVVLDRASCAVHRPEGVVFSIDAIAKGYIIDRALAAGRSAAPVAGMLVDIGGDMRCQGGVGDDDRWPVGLPDPRLPFINAPLVACAYLRDQAIATSGRGPRDRAIGGEIFGNTFASETGWPVTHNLAATVVAPTAAEADGLATALLVMPPGQGLDLIRRRSEVNARITGADGEVHVTPGWAALEAGPGLMTIAAAAPRPKLAARPGAPAARPSAPAARPAAPVARPSVPAAGVAAALPKPAVAGPPVGKSGWLIDWAVQILYEAPTPDRGGRNADFRTPYMAMWITDKQNRPIRTLVLVGKEPDWQQDNHIWWSMYRDQARKLIELRSTATALSGRYPTFWPGYDDSWNYVSAGEYILHIETSRERGQHTYRSIPLNLGRTPFVAEIPTSAEGGGLKLVYGKRD
jgi:thiamine biosynthesis lipoprotein